MKAYIGLISLAALTVFSPAMAETPPAVAPAPNGIAIPVGFQNWRLIGVSQRKESQTLRATLGNSVAVDAARSGKTNPWPDGAILVKMTWKETVHERFENAVVPGDFVQYDFMIKDAQKYASTNGWGFARWKGEKLEPYGADANFANECVGCHGIVKDKDMVFTHPVKLP
jgi:hypothetical protein